jgi:putative salt-induced outer membrane protein
MRKQALFLALTAIVCGAAYADDSAIVDDSWAMRGLLGFAKTSGTTDNTTANGSFHIAHTWEDWKFLAGVGGLYGSTKGETTSQDFGGSFQANYNISDRLYWFGGLTYDDNKFSGFAYQEMLDTGVGYQFIKEDDTKLTGQVGIGVQRLQPETFLTDPAGGIVSGSVVQGESTSGMVVTAAVNFEHSFNPATKLLAGVAVQSGSANTMTTGNLALQVKMSDRLALAAGYQLIRNSKPPAGINGSSGLTTLNLVYELKNKKLAPQ